MLDTPACDDCPPVNNYEYTCVDDGDGDEFGVWTTNSTPCTTPDYDNSGTTIYDWDLNGGHQTIVCSRWCRMIVV